MVSLWRTLRESMRWVLRNPVLIVVMVALVAYHESAGSKSFLYTVSWERGDALLRAVYDLVSYVLVPEGAVAVLLGLFLASGISIGAVGITLAVFEGNKKRIRAGMRALFSDATTWFFLFQLISSLVAALLYVLAATILVHGLGLAGPLGAVLMFLGFVLGYPLLFMAVATFSIIVAARSPYIVARELATHIVQPRSFRRLLYFYVLRIGLELVLLALSLFVTAHLAAPPFVLTCIVILIVALPLTLIRTSGIILTLDVFKQNAWFYQKYRHYYEQRSLVD